MTDALIFSYFNIILGAIAILFLLLLWRIVVKYKRKKRNRAIVDNYIRYSLSTQRPDTSSRSLEEFKEGENSRGGNHYES